MRFHNKYAIAVLSIGSLMVFGATAAHAEVPDELDEALVLASAEYLGLQELSPELTAILVEGVDLATNAEIVNPAVLDELSETLADRNESNEASELFDDDGVRAETPLEELFDDELERDQQRWDQVGPMWLAAFETIRADFEQCKDGGASTSQCARTMAFSLQVAQAEAMLADLDERLAEISTLPEEDQTFALAALDADRAALESRLVRAEARLASIEQGVLPQQATRLASVLAIARDRAALTQGIDVAEQLTQGEQVTQNGTLPTTPTPQTGSQNAPVQPPGAQPPGAQPPGAQSPGADQRPAVPNTGSDQGNRPPAPGNSGNAGTNRGARP